MTGTASTSSSANAGAFRLSVWAPTIALLGLFWLLIFNQQRLEWTVNVTYSYGWAVPLLALFLIRERWAVRPQAAIRLRMMYILAIASILLVAYLPVRAIQEANPDWVKINWMAAGLCAVLTLLAFTSIGGFRYTRHFLFPVLFCFTALPWPVWMETFLLQELMRGNASICAEILTFFGLPAIAEGNLIQIANHLVNVEEACSGIRSLQTAFMMSLFLGELHMLGWLRRIGLLLASFAVAFIVNLLRTLLLTYLTMYGDAAERWHDTVGIVAMVLCLAALWGLSEWFRPKQSQAPRAAATPSREFRARPFPSWFAVAGAAWLICAEGLTLFWYTYHERRVPPAADWHVAWPENAPNFHRGEFAERTLALLKFNEGETASWTVDADYGWQMYYLTWAPGRVSKFLSRSHYPTVCLPATGMKLISELEPWDCEVDGVRIPFATYLFDQGGRDVYVFHAIIEDRPERPGEHLAYRQVDSSERLDSVLHGERNLGQRVLGLALVAPVSPVDARDIAQRVLQKIIRPGDAKVARGHPDTP